MKTETTFTPGPWYAMNVGEYQRISNHWIIKANSPNLPGMSQTICELNGPWKPKNYEANARLIAAAPIGYELAEYVLHLADVGVFTNERAFVLAQQFIAKAKGRP